MKINIKQVLSEAVSFYKENFKSLKGISFVVLIFTAYMQVMAYVPTMLKEYPLWHLVFGLLEFVGMVASIIILPKLYLAMPILINSLLGEKKITANEAYRQTKGKYWTMIGCSMLICIGLIPCIALVFMKIPFAVSIGSVYVAFILSFYYTLFPMIAIEVRTNQYLRKSTQMIKGNYKEVFLLTLITTTLLTAINGVLTYIFQGKTTELFIIGMAYAVVYFFVYPFASTVTVIVYRKLKRR